MARKSYLLRLLFTSLASFLYVAGKAQLTDKLFAIRNPSPGVFWFCSLDLGTATITDIAPAPFTSLGTGASSCVDVANERYYVCDGTTLYGFDANGVLPMTTMVLPVPASTLFMHVVHDPCDGSFHGLLYTYPSGCSVARYDPVTNVFTTTYTLPASQFLPVNPSAEFDPTAGVYIMTVDVQGSAANDLLCLDVNTGTILSADSMVQVPGEAFLHWALACGGTESGPLLYGTSLDMGPQVKFLGVCDPYDPVVSHVSGTSTPNGYWKPLFGGSCIDQVNGMFYWSGFGGQVIGASISTGTFLYNVSVAGGDLNFLEHFSSCACVNTNISEPAQQPRTAVRWTSTGVCVSNATSASTLDLFDARGSVIGSWSLSGGSSTIPVRLAAGCYVAQVRSTQQVAAAIRFVVTP